MEKTPVSVIQASISVIVNGINRQIVINHFRLTDYCVKLDKC